MSSNAMSNNKQRLELTWIGKNNPEYDIANIEPRILEERPELSNCTNDPNTENMIIHGDNLLALKALLPEYEGKVKSIYIDPPYNTGNAFEYYDDSVEHSVWLNLIRSRIEILYKLLRDDGSIWVSIDHNEQAYLKILLDEIFGRNNFQCCITWQRKYSVSNNFQGIASICDYILVYAKTDKFRTNLLPRTQESKDRYTNPDNDPRGPWKAVDYLNQATPEQRPNLCYEIVNPNTNQAIQNTKKAWKFDRETHDKFVADNKVWWGIDGRNSTPALKLFLSEVRDGMTPHNWWPYDEVGHTDEAKKESILLFGNKSVFDTPKPERLLYRILNLSTNPGDLVLDSFLGSGTTSAVAHKMGRKYIGIEMGDHAYTHCKVRLDKVIDGSDQGGISKTVGWKGGGAYKFYELAPSFVTKDEFGNPVIDNFYNDTKLIKAMCKLMNFTFAPSSTEYWKHGTGQGKNYLYVTTQLLTGAMIQQIVARLGADESLIICPKKFESGADKIDRRITIKKIPQSVLKACHFGKKEYLLPIKESALDEVDQEDSENE